MRRDVLEENVARLFARSWRPVAPSARFRAELTELLARQITQRVRRAETARSRPPIAAATRPSRALRIAASILLLLAGFLAVRLLNSRGTGATTPDDLVERGAVAILDGEAWRAATEIERARGLDVGRRAVRAATPATASFTLHLGSAGRVEVAPASSAAISPAGMGGARQIELAGRSARVRRDDSGERWRVATPGGAIDLERGLLVWTHLPGGPGGAADQVELRSGRAWTSADPEVALSLGQHAWIADGRLVAVGVDLDPDAAALPARRVAAGSDLGEASAEAQSGARTATLAGTLTWDPGARAPAGFRVTLLRRVRLPDVASPASVEFQGASTFTIEGLVPGAYEVLVEARGFAVARRAGVEIGTGRATPLALELRAPRRVTGLVREAGTGAPIAGAIVLAEELVPAQVVPFLPDAASAGWLAAATSAADGTFTLDGLDDLGRVLRVSAPGFAARWVSLAPAGTEGESARGPAVELAPGGTVRGRVSRADGSAWSGAIVIASRMGAGAIGERMSFGLARSDAAGEYAIGDLPPGGYVVFAHDPLASGTPATRDLKIVGEEVVVKNLGPTPERTRVGGVVRDADGRPMPDLDMLLSAENADHPDATSWIAARTGADGGFAFEGVEPRRYLLFAGRGLGTSFARIGALDVPLAPELRHDVILARGAIRGRVRSIDGRPAAGAWIILASVEGAHEEYCGRAQTANDGSFELLGLAPGTYRLSAHDTTPGVAAVRSAPVDVAFGPREVELEFAPGVELWVRVVDARGTPRSGVHVRFTDEAGARWQFTAEGTTDVRGELRVPGAAPGRWRIAVDGARERVLDLELGPRREVELRSDENPAPASPGPDDDEEREER